jgi:hypothetical protein
MKKILLFSTLTILSASVLFISCRKNGADKTFQSVLDLGGDFEDKVVSETKTTTVDTVINGDSLWACTTDTYNVIQGMDEFPLYNPNSSVIYPGNLLQGGSLKNATPDVIVVDRVGGTFSIDNYNGTWTSSATVNEVVKSEVTTAINDIISGQQFYDMASNISFSMSQVHSEQQLALQLGLDFTAYGVNVASQLGFTNSYDYTRFFVKLHQSYYTISMDLPATYDDLFAPTVTPEDLEPYVGPGNPACYISDVTYGRVFYLLVESTSSSNEISSSISASFSGVPGGDPLSANITTSSLSSLDNLNIKLFALGGSAQSTLLTVGSNNVNSLASILSDAGDITTGVPLSYVCRAVNGNSIASVNLATTYDVETCEPIGPVQGTYGNIPNPVLYLKAEDANTSNNGIISYNNATSPDQGSYAVGQYQGTNVGGLVVEDWPDDGGVNIASTSDPDNRPVFVPNALNGYPAIDFCHFTANGTSNSYDQEVTTELDIPGALFTNTNYTLYMVVSSPTKLNVEGNYISNVTNQAIDAGTFLQGSDATPYGQLTVGFNSNSNMIFGHNTNDLNVPIGRSSNFRLLTFRFSTIDGMRAFVADADVPLSSDAAVNIPLTSNSGLKLNATSLSNPGDDSRSQVVEIRAYNVALTDLHRKQIAQQIMNKYGL